MNRVEVLDKVGVLLLLPNTELATTKQVAEFYGIPHRTINTVVQRNREELENNGMIHMKFPEIRETINSGSNVVNVNTLELTPKGLGISPTGSLVFSKRTILNIGFMLEQSQIALEVRNQALNIIESASEEHKTMEITQEKQLLMSIMFATNEVERATAINTHLEYTNRHKKQFR